MKSQRQIEREYTYVLKHWPDPIRPDLAETMKLRTKPELLDHVLQGGLLSRKIVKDDNNEEKN